jgi:hypothetical protein
MIIFKRTINTGTTIFDTVDEFSNFRSSISSLYAYEIIWQSWQESGKFNPTVSWDGFGSSVLTMTAIFTTKQEIDDYLAAVSHLDEARDITIATLGWTITREFVN